LVVPLEFVRHRRARRYILRLTPEGVARVTVPPHGSITEARSFVAKHAAWLQRQRARQLAAPAKPRTWAQGDIVWFRGEPEVLAILQDEQGHRAEFADQAVPISDTDADLRPAIELHLWRLAARELPPRVIAFAAEQGLTLRKVMVRNQRSRWGSCSRRGTVSLNWRLVQVPPWVSDYLIWHELMHLRVMNHSPQFWAAVAGVCPEHKVAESWLRQHKLHLL